MTALIIAAAAWIFLHVMVAGAWRAGLVGRLGEARYRGLFSGLSAVALGFLIWAYGRAPYVELWAPSAALNLVPVMVMPAALLFLVGSLRATNPTMAGPDMAMKGELPVAGFTKITRHPMLWALALWAASHMVANGDLATLLLAGAVLVTALNGMLSIDRKRAAKFGEAWQLFIAKTSIIPFAAVAEGRQRVGISDIGILNITLSAVIYGIILMFHGSMFGKPAVILN